MGFNYPSLSDMTTLWPLVCLLGLVSISVAAPPSSVPSLHVSIPEVHPASNSTKPTPWHKPLVHKNETHTVTHVEISNKTTTEAPTHFSLKEEFETLRTELVDLRNELNQWIKQPYTQRVVLPALIGVVAAIVTMGLLCWIRACFYRCKMRGRSARIGALSRDVAGEKRLLVPMKDSDDEL